MTINGYLYAANYRNKGRGLGLKKSICGRKDRVERGKI